MGSIIGTGIVLKCGKLCAVSQFKSPGVSQRGNLTKLEREICRFPAKHEDTGLIKTFLLGSILGVLGTGALSWYVPVVDLQRERSLISVQPNGGNVETFQINLPRDRILVGLPNVENSIPAGMDWPGELLGDSQAELFKIRDANSTVIGVASRLASASVETGPFIEWVLHLPARGSMYVRMDVQPTADGVRNGAMIAGTRDFETLSGSVREQFISATGDDPELQGRIELESALVAPLGDSL